MVEKKVAKKELPMLVVSSKVKEYVQEIGGEGFRMGGDFPEALSEAVCILVKRAVDRAQGRGGKTVGPNDV